MNRQEKNTLLAISLGDGYIRKDGSLQLLHSYKQIDYLVYKVNLISKILNKSIKISKFDNSGYPGCRAYIYDKYFRVLRKFLYKDSIKTINKSVLNRLSPELIAIWFMDDGNMTLHKRNNKIHSREIYLNTYCTEKEAKIIQEFFLNKYDIFFRVAPSKGKFRMVCNTKNAKKFVSLVEPFIIDSMRYKIDLKYALTLEEAPRNRMMI